MKMFDLHEPIYGSSNDKDIKIETLEFTEDYLKHNSRFYDVIKNYKPIYKNKNDKNN